MRITRIISSLRNLSGYDIKMSSYEVVSVSEIVKETLGLCLEKIKSENVTLEVSVPEELQLVCNPFDISQVVLNLLNNSLGAVQNDENKVIQIKSWQTNAKVMISVTDTGPEIPVEIRSKIFDPFFSTKHIGQGTGPGLSIFRGIIQAYRGDIFLDETQKSTTFTVVLRLPA